MRSAWPVFPVLFSLFGALQAQAAPLSLTDAIQYALEHSPAFDTARKTEEIRGLEYKSALAKFFPTLEFTTTDGLQNNIPVVSTTGGSLLTPNPVAPWFSTLNLSLNETLYDNGVSLTNLGVASTRKEIARLESEKARDALILDVASGFYKLSSAVASREIQHQQEDAISHQYKLVTGLYQQGLKTKSDFLRLKSQVQRAEIERISAENNVITAAANLRKSLGAGQDVDFAPLPVPRDPALVEQIPAAAPELEKTYDFQLKKLQEEANEGAVTLAHRNVWPQISLTGGIQYANQSFLNPTSPFGAGQTLNWDALVTVQYSLWDWGTKRRDAEIADRNRDIQENALQAGIQDDHSKIVSLMADLARLRQSLKLAMDLLSLEEESAHHLEAQYREGKASYLDLITGLTNYYGAKTEYGTTYFDTLQALATHAYYRGEIREELKLH